jgi:hypothetical protein
LNGLVVGSFWGGREKGVLAVSILELICAWLDPAPVASYVSAALKGNVLDLLENMSEESGGEYEEICGELLTRIRKKWKSVRRKESAEVLPMMQEQYARGLQGNENGLGMLFASLSN